MTLGSHQYFQQPTFAQKRKITTYTCSMQNYRHSGCLSSVEAIGELFTFFKEQLMETSEMRIFIMNDL